MIFFFLRVRNETRITSQINNLSFLQFNSPSWKITWWNVRSGSLMWIYTSLLPNQRYDLWVEENILHWNDIHLCVKYEGAISFSTLTINAKAEVLWFTEDQTFSLLKALVTLFKPLLCFNSKSLTERPNLVWFKMSFCGLHESARPHSATGYRPVWEVHLSESKGSLSLSVLDSGHRAQLSLVRDPGWAFWAFPCLEEFPTIPEKQFLFGQCD